MYKLPVTGAGIAVGSIFLSTFWLVAIGLSLITFGLFVWSFARQTRVRGGRFGVN